jgi:hypothetical protein
MFRVLWVVFKVFKHIHTSAIVRWFAYPRNVLSVATLKKMHACSADVWWWQVAQM